MKGIVHSVELSKSGKSYKINISGCDYTYKTENPPSVGDNVEFEYEPSEYKGNTYYFIQRLRKAGGSSSAPTNGGGTTPQGVAHPDASRLVSNVIAAACTASLIDGPDELQVWIKAAYFGYMDAINDYKPSVKDVKEKVAPPKEVVDFNDDIPW